MNPGKSKVNSARRDQNQHVTHAVQPFDAVGAQDGEEGREHHVAGRSPYLNLEIERSESFEPQCGSVALWRTIATDTSCASRVHRSPHSTAETLRGAVFIASGVNVRGERKAAFKGRVG